MAIAIDSRPAHCRRITPASFHLQPAALEPPARTPAPRSVETAFQILIQRGGARNYRRIALHAPRAPSSSGKMDFRGGEETGPPTGEDRRVGMAWHHRAP